jgi:hypothetical protein
MQTKRQLNYKNKFVGSVYSNSDKLVIVINDNWQTYQLRWQGIDINVVDTNGIDTNIVDTNDKFVSSVDKT